MPGYEQNDLNPFQSLVVHFLSLKDREDFQRFVLKEKARTNTNKTMKWTIYPTQGYKKWTDKNALPSKVEPNKYPIYVISKGRWENPLTIKQLNHLGIEYRLVIEPQELKKYLSSPHVNSDKILTLPTKNFGGGCSIPARNWCWEHSIKSGAPFHWILDDNIQGFFELNHNRKPKIRDYNPFRVVEHFVDQFQNIGISGMNYEFFVQRRNAHPAYVENTRVYSCILIRNDLPFRWRGRYNEDTDLSLRVLKSGLCTVLFNYVLAKKVVTMTMKGGNTDSLYKLKDKDGRLEMAKALCELHPDVSKIVHKWGRWQHHVDYSGFHQRLKWK